MDNAYVLLSAFLTGKPIYKSIAELVFLLVVFVLILVACVFTTKFVAGRQMTKTRNGNFKPIETYQIAQNRYLQLVQIGKRYFVISVCKDRVELITELAQEDFVLPEPTATGTMKSFKDILSDFKAKVDKHDEERK